MKYIKKKSLEKINDDKPSFWIDMSGTKSNEIISDLFKTKNIQFSNWRFLFFFKIKANSKKKSTAQ